MTTLASPTHEAITPPTAAPSPMQFLQERVEATLAGLRQTRESFAVTLDRHLAELQDLREVLAATSGVQSSGLRPPTRAGNLPPVPLMTDTAPLMDAISASPSQLTEESPFSAVVGLMDALPSSVTPLPAIPAPTPLMTKPSPFEIPVGHTGANTSIPPVAPPLVPAPIAKAITRPIAASMDGASPFAQMPAMERPSDELPAGMSLFGSPAAPAAIPVPAGPPTVASPFASALATPPPLPAAPLQMEGASPFAAAAAYPNPVAQPTLGASPFSQIAAELPAVAAPSPFPMPAAPPPMQAPAASPFAAMAAPVAPQLPLQAQPSPFGAAVQPQAPIMPQLQASPFAAAAAPALAESPFAAAAASPFAPASVQSPFGAPVPPSTPAPAAGPSPDLEAATLEELNAALSRAFSQVANRPQGQLLSLPLAVSDIPATRDMHFA
jgi:hypothetical protein